MFFRMKIESLHIYTANLEEQLKFFRDLFRLKIQNYSENSFEVVIGYSILKFTQSANATPYHIAFHIPRQTGRSCSGMGKRKSSYHKK